MKAFNAQSKGVTEPKGSGFWIIGYGNPHCRDDGIGPYIANRLLTVPAGRPKVFIRSLPYLEASLIDDLFDAHKVVFIDATTKRLPLGWEWKPVVPQTGPWPWTVHDFSVPLLLGMMNAYCGRCPEAWMISVQGDDFDLGEGLSQAAECRAAKVVQEIAGFLKNS